MNQFASNASDEYATFEGRAIQLGMILLRDKFATEKDIHDALLIQKNNREKIGTILLQKGVISPQQLSESLLKLRILTGSAHSQKTLGFEKPIDALLLRMARCKASRLRIEKLSRGGVAFDMFFISDSGAIVSEEVFCEKQMARLISFIDVAIKGSATVFRVTGEFEDVSTQFDMPCIVGTLSYLISITVNGSYASNKDGSYIDLSGDLYVKELAIKTKELFQREIE